MSAEENKAIALRWNQFTRKELEEIPAFVVEMLHPRYVNRSGTASPWAVAIDGIDEAKRAFAELRRTRPTFDVTVEDIVAEGDRVAVRMIFYENGEPSANALAFYRLEDGKIVDDYFVSEALQTPETAPAADAAPTAA